MKLWTVQAPEVAAQLARGSSYSAGWDRVLPRWVGAYEVMTAEMTARGIDCLQATIPRIRARWVRRARPMPMPRDTRREILRDPDLRHLLIPPESTAH